ncbi:uncharacterized protein LOC126552159 isoform X7 [Aphis gossypii]|uniref:uncharacterized protein LOC126552159 isoform X2 n=1 Tax=Aphis gossypii TaxID=80765 RepID=UPI002158C2F9|nr:uncharacterized protein LOC126552159 isoform X2 [Aphis gossypii]XP_050062737.1 uncharacterized protein LOC126552159 isoform X3 [Aphis gossypii]XP_050062738.1 uncharacterized protein LOC126552159 isoform X4 [Aphis gossypii]XP_050062739.1 uncharacterized protein LOC126552159 isoform X5 [Aphis gossypii]XP_050062740.1 uncharacterized protein LOC126552159 isoform X6 [Aphis gossypii]XP_050062741.1 uncharacterized protein LOC126552159 isoform X7 [Aphis gossypii]
MSDENKIWSVVEFGDGSIHIIPKNWFLDKSKCYWLSQGTFKTINAYIKAVKKMGCPDENWPIFEAQILAESDDFDVAFNKLKKAETYSDLATDAEQDKLSRNLRHKKRKISSSSSSDEDKSTKITLVKVPAVPKPPSGGKNTSDIDKKKLASGTVQFYQKNKSSNKPVSYDYKEHVQSPIYGEAFSSHQTNSKNVRRSLSYNSEPSSDCQTDSKNLFTNLNYEEPSNGRQINSKRFHQSPSYDEFSRDHPTNSKNLFTSLNYEEPSNGRQINSKRFHQSPSYDEFSRDHPTNSKNLFTSLNYEEPSNGRQINSKRFHQSPSYDEFSRDHPTNSKNSCQSSSYDNNLTDNKSLFPKGKNCERCLSNNDFQDRVLRQLSHIKLHLFKLDEKLSALNYPSLQNTNIIDFYDTNILDNFPLQCEQDLQNVEIKLTNDDIYKSNMLTALSKMGGSKTDEATRYILKKIYADKLAMCYSWMGGKKGKKVLSTMILPKIIIEVVQKRIYNCTEIDIVDSIKNWLRNACQRNLNSLKAAEKRSLDLHKEDDN